MTMLKLLKKISEDYKRGEQLTSIEVTRPLSSRKIEKLLKKGFNITVFRHKKFYHYIIEKAQTPCGSYSLHFFLD